MRPGMRRGLTEGETALARGVFGSALRTRPVRIMAGPRWPDRPFVPGRFAGRFWVVYPAPLARADFATAPLGAQATFIHELVHVWQAQQGVLLPLAKLRAGDSEASYA